MLEKWITVLLKPDLAPDLIRAELERLQAGGFLSADDVQQLLPECAEALAEGSQRARKSVMPLLEAAGSTLRGALDLPSRAEILALTEALQAQQAADTADPSSEA